MPAVYFAPLQSMTTYIYRNAHNRVFSPSIDKYYSPFFMAHEKCNFNFKEEIELGIKENSSHHMIPQILTRKAEDVIRYQKVLQDMGYEELNVNLGCPSKTVTSKGRGSAFLIYRDELDRFLYEIFSNTTGKISVKTRIGTESPEEFVYLTEIFNQYPISELIIHPRTMKQFYEGTPHRESFLYAVKYSKNPLVYNGDIWTAEDWNKLLDDIGKVAPERHIQLMIGRSAIADPALARKIKGIGGDARAEEYEAMLHEIIREYQKLLPAEYMILYRLKELWSWMIRLFPACSEEHYLLNHSDTLDEYLKHEHAILSSID